MRASLPELCNPDCSPAPPKRSAVLFACATVASMRGLRFSMLASQDPSLAPRRLACCTTVIAPKIRSRRSVRSLILEIRPSFVLPPVDCCRGARPGGSARVMNGNSEKGRQACVCNGASSSSPRPGATYPDRVLPRDGAGEMDAMSNRRPPCLGPASPCSLRSICHRTSNKSPPR